MMSLLFNLLFMFVIVFLPRSKCLLISCLHSPSAMILKPKKIKSVPVFIVSPSICHEVMGPDAMILKCRLYVGESDGNPLQYSCPENPIDRGAWRAKGHGVTQSQTQLKQLSIHAHRLHIFIFMLGMWNQSLCLYQ